MTKLKYNPVELKTTLVILTFGKYGKRKLKGFSDKKKVRAAQAEIKKKFGILKSRKNLNKKIAEHHGISVEALIASKNYKVLCEEFNDDYRRGIIEIMKKRFKLADKEAWALVCNYLGLLDEGE